MSRSLIIRDLKAEIPVIQGGMGVGVSLAGLAGAVAKCGGIGIISTAQIGYQDPEFDQHPIESNLKAIKTQISRAKEIAEGGIVGVNIMVATTRYEDYVRAAAEAGADLIISGAGLPVSLPGFIGSSGAKIAPIVSSLKSASVVCRLWDRKYSRCPDLVVIEGPKAGGHLGFSLEELGRIQEEDYETEIKEIIELVGQYSKKYQYHIPVVVAGGIYDGKDMKHMLELGADGVQVATRFVTTWECDASQAYKDAYLRAGKDEIQIVKSPVGMPGRAIRNSFIRKMEEQAVQKEEAISGAPHNRKCHQCLEKCNPSEIPYCITDALINAVKGNTEHGLVFCGANAWRAENMEHVSDIMKEFSEYL